MAAVVLSGVVRAQEIGSAAACSSIDSDSERLACYDRALRPSPQTAAQAAASTAVPAAASPSPSATTASPATATQLPPSSASAASPAAAAAAPLPSQPTQAVAPPPRPAHAASPSSATPPLGVVPIVVLNTRALPGRGVEFTTDRGDVWVQSDTRSLQLPPTPFNARIEPGTFGSVFLIPENRLGIRVRHRE